MIIYLSIPLLVLTAFISSKYYPRLSKINNYLVFIFIFVFSGVRYNVGVDFKSYMSFIEEISHGVDTYLEVGFEFFSYQLISLGATPQLVFFLFSFITCILFVISINKYSMDRALSLLLFCLLPFFYLGSFNQIRQYLVASILAYSIESIYKRKLLKFISLILIASSFHKIAILFIPMYWFAYKVWTKKLYVTSLLAFIICCSFIDILASYIGISQSYIVDNVQTKFDVRSFIYLGLFSYSLFLYKQKVSKQPFGFGIPTNEAVVVSINMAFICFLILLSPLFVTNVNSSELLRITSLFSFSLLLLIPFVIKNIKQSYIRFASIVFIVLFSIAYFTYTILVNGERYSLLPYDGSLVLFQ